MPHPLGIVQATGIAVGMADKDKTPQGVSAEQAMTAAAVEGMTQGESDDQVRARIIAARDAVLKG